jgi:glutathione S-transferase
VGADRIHHLAVKGEWLAAVASGRPYDRSTRGVSLEEQGFIHCSFAEQVRGTAELYYPDLDDVVVLTIDPALLDVPVEVEGGFPHVYGPIPLHAVVAVDDLPLE